MNHTSIKILACIAILFATPTVNADVLLQQVKKTPEVTFDKVEEIFGYNLTTKDPVLSGFLLAVGMDHTSANSPHIDKNIGVPFIVDRGPQHWISRLRSNDRSVEVLVNNAILLLFTKEELPSSNDLSMALIKEAADKGYWPANFYIAEMNLLTHLSKDFNEFSVLSDKITSREKILIAKDTMSRLNSCAEIGFAPCQYRVGFWLLGSESSVGDGLLVLRQAIKSTLADIRYQGLLDGALKRASQQVVIFGSSAGMDNVEINEYRKLLAKKTAS